MAAQLAPYFAVAAAVRSGDLNAFRCGSCVCRGWVGWVGRHGHQQRPHPPPAAILALPAPPCGAGTCCCSGWASINQTSPLPIPSTLPSVQQRGCHPRRRLPRGPHPKPDCAAAPQRHPRGPAPHLAGLLAHQPGGRECRAAAGPGREREFARACAARKLANSLGACMPGERGHVYRGVHSLWTASLLRLPVELALCRLRSAWAWRRCRTPRALWPRRSGEGEEGGVFGGGAGGRPGSCGHSCGCL